MFSTVRRMVKDGHSTLHGWRVYKRQSGQWPWVSVAAHSLHWIVAISGLVILFWCAWKYEWSRFEFIGIFVAAMTADLCVWEWIRRKLKLNQIRAGRRL